ncbi:MAG: glycine-rich domain-containing protein [Hyphomicrobiaceae bacterium]
MKYQPPFVPGATPGAPGIYNADVDASYVNGDPSIGQEGSYFPGEALEHTQREIVAQLVAAGLTPDHTVLTQLRQSIARSASGATWFACTGAANAYTLLASGAFDVPSSPFGGQLTRLIANHTNSGAATATFAGVTKAIRSWADAALVGGEIVANRPTEAVYSATANSGAGALLLLPWADARVGKPDAQINTVGNVQVFTASGTFTVPDGITQVAVDVWGAGGAGGASSDGTGLAAGSAGAGGGAGGYARKLVTVTPGDVIAVTVGAGGAGVSNAAVTGGAGGTSSFGAHVSCTGGAGGPSGRNSLISGGLGGSGTGGDINISGGLGGTGGNPSSYTAAIPLHIMNKGGIPGVPLGFFDNFGTGAAGRGFGTGGTGASGGSALAGGNGAPGLVIVRW